MEGGIAMNIGNSINAFDILQSLKLVDEPVSVVLITDGNGRDMVGRIYLSGGKIYHVEYEDVQGPGALKYLMNAPVKKAFIVRMDKPLPYSSVSVNVEDFLLRASFYEGDDQYTDVHKFDDIKSLLGKEDSIMAFFVIRDGDKAELVDMVYIKDAASSSKINLAFRALDVVRRMREAFPGCEFLLCKRGEFLHYIKKLSRGEYGVLVSTEDAPVDILKLIMDRVK